MTGNQRPGPAVIRPTSTTHTTATKEDRWPHNDRMQLTAPLGGRGGNVGVAAAASRPPFGERRRRS
jgi:hypothetical protein